jgi:hypothetical protein
MHQGQLVFAQLMRHLPLSTFRRCVAHYDGEHKVKSFSCLDQYLCMAFAQLTYREAARYSGVPASAGLQALSLGDPRLDCAQHTRQRQCHARLAYLRQFCSAADSPGAWSVCRGALRSGFGRDSVCARCHNDRSVSVGVSVGTVSLDQGRHQTAYAARSASVIRDWRARRDSNSRPPGSWVDSCN